MEYKKLGQTFFVRIDRGEEIVDSLKILADAENIEAASVSALGAAGEFTVGVLDTSSKEYRKMDFEGNFEIVSLAGTITLMDKEVYLHLHMSAGDGDGRVFGGHLHKAVVSATCEAVVNVCEGGVTRKYDGESGLNLFCFDS